MSSCRSNPCGAIEAKFDARVARRELAQYRKKGPGPTTKLLRDGVSAGGGSIETLLDIGAGIGALTFELLERGVRRALSVDASSAFVAAGREEAARRNRAEQVEWIQGDYVALAEKLPAADTVTLDRVVCCYPRFEPLLGAAARHAHRCIAVSYPRDVWFVRIALAGQNALRALKGDQFRTILHPPREMEQLVRSQGFTLSARRTTWVWCADVYLRINHSSPQRKESPSTVNGGLPDTVRKTAERKPMPKPLLGAILGAVLGLLDGLSALLYPEAAPMIVQIVMGSTIKGVLTGLLAGVFARKMRSLPLGIAFALAVGLGLSFLAASAPDAEGRHHYFEIMLPGGILGALVGFATQRYGAAKGRAS